MKNLVRFAEIEGHLPPVAPYSHGVTAQGRFLFISGQGPYDPAKGSFVRESIADQTRLTLACLERVMEHAGGRRENVVQCRVYLQPLNEETFAAMNAIYEEFFGAHKPARTTVGSQLLGIDVEIDAIVLLDE